jgi:hypothetical protein
MGAGVGGAAAGVYLGDAVQLAQFGTIVSLLSYSRELEAEADAMGLRLIAEAGYDPHAMPGIWQQLVEEIEASARMRKKRPHRGYSLFATHPAPQSRMVDLRASAAEVSGGTGEAGRGPRPLSARARPASRRAARRSGQIERSGRQPLHRREPRQGRLDRPAALLRSRDLASAGEKGDDVRAAAGYAAAVQLPDAPAEAWRMHGYALIKAGQREPGKAALGRYLAMAPGAKDAAMVAMRWRSDVRANSIKYAHAEEGLSLSKARLEAPVRPSRRRFDFAQRLLMMSGVGGKMRRTVVPLAAALLLTACAGGGGLGYYSLVQPQPRAVAAGTMTVTPSTRWNRVPRSTYDIGREENWTLNGPLLDSLTFIGGLENDKRIVVQRRKADRKVPNFRADMSPPEIAAMIESFYRIRAGATTFDMDNLAPRAFLGQPGFQFDYRYLTGNELERRGRAVGAIIGGRFYLALFDAARMHYFDAGLPEFERIVTSAALRGQAAPTT